LQEVIKPNSCHPAVIHPFTIARALRTPHSLTNPDQLLRHMAWLGSARRDNRVVGAVKAFDGAIRNRRLCSPPRRPYPVTTTQSRRPALACLVLLAQPAAASSNLLTVVASSNPDKGRGAIFDPTHYANRQIMPELPLIPLHRQMNIWALRKA
jgi:hypothetical protein